MLFSEKELFALIHRIKMVTEISSDFMLLLLLNYGLASLTDALISLPNTSLCKPSIPGVGD